MSSIRAQKVSDFLRKEISLLISTEINDPRLKNINITAVKVSSDIGQATIYYTIIGQEEPDLNLAPKTLEKLSGMLRSRLSKIMKIRRVPKLSFRFDESIEYSNNIEEMKSKLVKQLYKPVLWTSIVQKMKNSGVEKLIETGPGKVLAGLTRRIDKSLSGSAIIDTTSLRSTIEEISNA